MANLVIDIGNSRIKVAVFDNRELIYTEAFAEIQPELIEQLISTYQVSRSILSSVAGNEQALENALISQTRYLRFSVANPTGLTIKYLSPETLGLDRLAGVIAARALFPDRNSIVIDAGTCITYDFVDSAGIYRGGSISPGINMRFKALNNFTGKLPLVEKDEAFTAWIGTDTRTSLLTGVLEGAFLEVQGFIEKYNSKYTGLQVLLCGGDADFFDTRLKNSIFAHSVKTNPHLVLIGLNEVIHHYND